MKLKDLSKTLEDNEMVISRVLPYGESYIIEMKKEDNQLNKTGGKKNE